MGSYTMTSDVVITCVGEHAKGCYVYPPEILVKFLKSHCGTEGFLAQGVTLNLEDGTPICGGIPTNEIDGVKHDGAEGKTGLILRPLEKSDFEKGYLSLLSQLTEIGDISKARFEERFNLMKDQPGRSPDYYVCVIEDAGRVVTSASLTIERKLIRNCGDRGRIEDVVVDKEYRCKHLGKLLLNMLVELAKHIGIYKLSLECKDPLVTYYTKFGFIKEQNQNFMSIRFNC